MVCKCLLFSAGWGLKLDGVKDAAIGRCFCCIFRRSSSGDATLRRGSRGGIEEEVENDPGFEGAEKHDATATSWSTRRMQFFIV
mmetsp:Transcript_18696/g.28898  ORF Transcript_18696/g.28898 Transcript_18696/m.28898 type:complete len:84 (+) Transcript_18696:135-386(+)